mmetsp:Transcript_15591/g.24932  ORF Transcript_15591/g.24932 Transcript_15591/m.24932 type:complete len:209 (-) Transcript_15591:2035-2661(-)
MNSSERRSLLKLSFVRFIAAAVFLPSTAISTLYTFPYLPSPRIPVFFTSSGEKNIGRLNFVILPSSLLSVESSFSVSNLVTINLVIELSGLASPSRTTICCCICFDSVMILVSGCIQASSFASKSLAFVALRSCAPRSIHMKSIYSSKLIFPSSAAEGERFAMRLLKRLALSEGYSCFNICFIVDSAMNFLRELLDSPDDLSPSSPKV